MACTYTGQQSTENSEDTATHTHG